MSRVTKKIGGNIDTIQIEIAGTGIIRQPKGVKAGDVIKYEKKARISPVVAVKINNSLEDLKTELIEDSHLEFIDLESEDGLRIYQSGLIMVLNRASQEVLPGSAVIIEHSLSNAIYGEIIIDRALKADDIEKIEKKMKSIISSKCRIERTLMSRTEAVKLFLEKGYKDKADLLSYWGSYPVEVIKIDDYYDYSLGPIIPDLSVLRVFRLRLYLPGFILELPKKEDPLNLPVYEEQGKLSTVFYEAGKWRRIIKVSSLVALNQRLSMEDPGELIRVAEAFQEKRISQLADEISRNDDRIRIVLIAGPSSSGKTTFLKRLAIYLQVNGINPVSISLDDYFLEREHTPKDEYGEYDFESLDALDRKLFNDHLNKLVQGEEIEVPSYNFITGKREYSGKRLRLEKNDLIMLEGIHGINDLLTTSIPKGRKFKIYISALTHMNLDFNNRIHTTDLRLIRRIVRDSNFRGFSAERTLEIWPSVRRGEEKYIFPFQEQADVMFNSSLIYELAVLKGYAEPLLKGINKSNPQYSEARRLIRLLSFFEQLDSSEVPPNSILREYIGSSCFYTQYEKREKVTDKTQDEYKQQSQDHFKDQLSLERKTKDGFRKKIIDWVDVLMPPRF